MQRLLVPAESSTGLPPLSLRHSFGVKAEALPIVGLTPVAVVLRSGAYTPAMVQSEKMYQAFKGVKTDLPNGYNMMDATSRLNVIANNLLRIAQAWGWDFTIGDHRFFQPSQHKWETLSRDFGNNALSNSLISMVKGEYLSNLVLDGLVKASYTSEPETYLKEDTFSQRSAKLWHNTVRHPVRKTFGLSAHPLTTIGHVLPPEERHWLVMKPLDTNILKLKNFGESLSLKTTFDAIQAVLLSIESPDQLMDILRKSGTRRELKQLMVDLEPEKTIEPQIMAALESLFDEKTGNLKKNAHELAKKTEADITYFLNLYKPCGGQGATESGIKQLLKQVLATEECPITSAEGLPATLSAKKRAMAQANHWFNDINTTWRTEANNAIRLSTQTILEAVGILYNQEVEKATARGETSISREALAKRFALEVAPKLMSKTGNTYSGELAAILDPAFQLSQRTALLEEYNTHRNRALLAQTITQAVFTCFVLGNLLFFVVFNTLARLDVDFTGPHGETRLDFGQMKRKLKRWIRKQLGQGEEDPQARIIHPKVTLDLSLGQNLTLRKEQQLLTQFKRPPQAITVVGLLPTMVTNGLPLLTNNPARQPQPTTSFYLKQAVANYLPQAMQPAFWVEGEGQG